VLVMFWRVQKSIFQFLSRMMTDEILLLMAYE